MLTTTLNCVQCHLVYDSNATKANHILSVGNTGLQYRFHVYS